MTDVVCGPFSAVYDRSTRTTHLSGDLDTKPESAAALRGAMSDAAADTQGRSSITVVSGGLTLVSDAVTLYIGLANELLADITIVYEPSQLRDILSYDDRYHHTRSTYLEDHDA